MKRQSREALGVTALILEAARMERERRETRDSVVALGQPERSEGVDDVTCARQRLAIRMVKWRVRLRGAHYEREKKSSAHTSATACNGRAALRYCTVALQRPSRTFALGLPRREKEHAGE